MNIFSFRWRLFLAIILVIAIAIGAVLIFISSNLGTEIRDTQGAEMAERVSKMQNILQMYYEENQGWDGVQGTIEQMGKLYNLRVILLQDNMVVSDSSGALTGLQINPEKPFMTEVQGIPGEPNPPGIMFVSKIAEDGKTTIEPMMLAARGPGPPGPPPGGWGDLRQKEIGQFRSSLNWAVLWAGLLGVGLAGLITFFWSRSLTVPLRSVAEAARKLAKGDLKQRVQVKSKDEIGELAHDFNQMAEELENTQNLRRNMIADIAHELRTPLSNIQGYVEAIHDGVIPVDESSKEYMYTEVQLLTRLVEDLHELALAESGEINLFFEDLDLREVAETTAKAIDPMVKAKKLQFEVLLPSEPALATVDRWRTAQVLRNLLVNAINFTPEGGKITLELKNMNHEIEMSVSDTGAGIPAEDLPHIFERFYRVDKSRSRKTGGTGLGLTIARQLVKVHHGEIHVESEINRGTRFYFTLPALQHKAS